MAKRPELEICQVSPGGSPQELQYLLTAEQAELRGTYQGFSNSVIVTLRGIRRQFPEASELIDHGWSDVAYRARVQSYGETAVKPFVWGWSAEVEPLDSRSPDDVETAIQEAKELANQQAGLTSSLVVYRHKPHGAYEIARQAKFGDEQKMYVTTNPNAAEDMMYCAIDDDRGLIAAHPSATIHPVDKLPAENWTAMETLRDSLDSRFIELLQDHKIVS